ncbi:MAG: SHOCT domain-containing protein [Actinomycetota bacterium]|nr:SHOCT domain-containing protein [Actinomycetota bacterium]
MNWCPWCGNARGYSFGGGAWGGFGSLLSFLFTLLIIVGIVLLILWLIRQSAGGAVFSSSTSKALETLKERYVKGEIDKKQFEEMKKDLKD